MTTDETIMLLEHLSNCDFCLNDLISKEEQRPTVSAPAYLQEQILRKAASPEIQAQKAVKHTSYRMQMFYCGLRAATGVIVALFLLFTLGSVDFASLNPPQNIHTEAREAPLPDAAEAFFLIFPERYTKDCQTAQHRLPII